MNYYVLFIYMIVSLAADSEEHSVHADAVEFGSLSRCLSGNLLAAGFSHAAGTIMHHLYLSCVFI